MVVILNRVVLSFCTVCIVVFKFKQFKYVVIVSYKSEQHFFILNYILEFFSMSHWAATYRGVAREVAGGGTYSKICCLVNIMLHI